MNTQFLAVTLVSILATASCGRLADRKSDDEKNPADAAVDADTTALLSDDQVASQQVSSIVDEAVADLTEGNEASSSNFALADLDKEAKAIRYRHCDHNDETSQAVVTVKRGTERQVEFASRVRTAETSFKQMIERTRTWSRASGDVACATDGKHADLQRASLEGVSLVSEFKNERSRSFVIENLKRDTKVSGDLSSKGSGTRNVKWTSVKSENSVLTLTSEVRTDATWSLSATNKKGTSVAFELAVKTAEDAPLIVVSERDASSDELQSRTIVSGKKIATSKAGNRTETSFHDVKYTPSGACMPVSGQIEGALYAKDAEVASATFKIDFDGDSKTITITRQDGTTTESEFVTDGCEIDSEQLEATPNATEEVNSASDVTLAA